MQVTLTVVAGPHAGKEFVFREHDAFLVGRGTQAHFRLPKDDMYFSRLHFLVEVNPPQCRLMDLRSRNGTKVNGEPVEAAELRDGDVVRAGKTHLRVTIVEDEPSLPPTVSMPKEPEASSASDSSEFPRPADDPSLVGGQSGVEAEGGLPELAPLDDSDPPQDLRRFLPADFEDRIRSQPQPIAGYLLIRELGRGGMGTVHQALRESDGSVVALKTILPAVAARDADKQRFLREAGILRTMAHRNIVAFRDLGESGGLLYFAMDFVPGRNASQALKEHGGPLPIGRAVRIVRDLLSALDYAHRLGFVHRDIKPANLLLVDDGGRDLVKLADFGLARTYQSTGMSGCTVTGEIAGTVPYMPPEQITDFRHAKPAADQYSSAAALYNLLTARHVYDFPKDPARQLLTILQDEPVPIRDRRPDVPDGLAIAIHKALSREPSDRFADVADFRAALAAFGA